VCGRIDFEDKKNGLTAWYEISAEKKRPLDYFVGEIIKGDKVVSKMYGNQMGYIDFDGIRYWDVREQVNYIIKGVDMNNGALPSDSRKRIDSVAYKAGDMVQA
jgi:hypothetical protein